MYVAAGKNYHPKAAKNMDVITRQSVKPSLTSSCLKHVDYISTILGKSKYMKIKSMGIQKAD